MELKSFYFAESQNLRETKTRRCKIRTVKRDNETWRRTTKIQLMKSLKFRGRSFVLLSIVLLLSFLAVRECKWHTWQVWLIIKPRSAVTCGSAHRKKKTKKTGHSVKQSRMKKAYDPKHLAPLSYLTFPSGSCCGLLLQSVFPAWETAPTNIYHLILISPLCLCLNFGRLKRL